MYMFMYFNTLYLLIIKNPPKASQAKPNMEDKEKNRQLWESLLKRKKLHLYKKKIWVYTAVIWRWNNYSIGVYKSLTALLAATSWK